MFFQLLLGPGGGISGIGQLLLFEIFRSLPHILADVIEFVPFLRHVGPVFRCVHPLAQIVDFPQQLFLFFLEAL